jgi:cell division protein ZapD
MIIYEYPFNERIRILLRLEDLFDRLSFHASHEHALEHHAALDTLFEILEVAGRADLKSDLLQELERQRQALSQFRNAPEVASDLLDSVLADIEQAAKTLNESTGKIGQHLRENEWLMSLRSRMIIPGGTCEFDLPSYYAWRHREALHRSQDLERWIAPLRPLRQALAIVLKLLRESSQTFQVVAASGSYQQMLSGKTYQMMQVRIDATPGYVPEISANKYMLWVRFTLPDGEMRSKPAEADISFDLTLCNL